MAEKRLIIRPVPRSSGVIPNPEGPPIKFDKIDLGIGKRPRYLVVVRGLVRSEVSRVISRLANGDDFPAEMAGSPIVYLPDNSSLEVFEVDP